MTSQPEHMRNHWWWRPGWSVGRRFYTWHLTFGEQHDVHRFAEQYRKALSHIDGLDPIPDQWLHLTMQGVGFVDEVDRVAVDAIVEAARVRLAAVPGFDLTLSTPRIDPEAVLVPVQPDGAVRAVRHAIRSAIRDVLPEVPEASAGFMPHVSVAYSNNNNQLSPLSEALAAVDIPPATARVKSAELIVLHRDNRMYEWTPYVQVPLG
ncbi:2'-5' RNA ligase family protein [Streptomyces sp. AK02-01A]|uniref:2'-5' RNA ligase family protein n=1 Tax=Streptomyces sp. AK02-01A TaxID=3028648 RepID=UPI0029A29F50|nr:2'-5' RNA ligase family protein [Streptomyces sp. AK02-01A]MDX3855853.1 2'-5' RNA ligase family protein [Streptomyces sp. AK02-01A]